MTSPYLPASLLTTFCIILYILLTWTCLLIFEEIRHFSPCCFCLVYPLTTHASFYLAVSYSAQSSSPGSLSLFLWVWTDGIFLLPLYLVHFYYFTQHVVLGILLIFLRIKTVYFLVLRLEIAFYSIIFVSLTTMVLSTSSGYLIHAW